jgi:hypothetical protein
MSEQTERLPEWVTKAADDIMRATDAASSNQRWMFQEWADEVATIIASHAPKRSVNGRLLECVKRLVQQIDDRTHPEGGMRKVSYTDDVVCQTDILENVRSALTAAESSVSQLAQRPVVANSATTAETPTPRTDAVKYLCFDCGNSGRPGGARDTEVVPAEEMAKLERELSALKKDGRVGDKQYTYASEQATNCAGCGKYKHTPLRRDDMGGYVCLTCIDTELTSLREKVEELEADKRRLEGLARSGAKIAYSRDGETCWLHWPYGKDGDYEGVAENQEGAYYDFREAIDTALAQLEEGK